MERKSVVSAFDGGAITSNADALLLGQLDHGLGLVCRFAGCFTDRRDPRFVEHRLETLLGQRIFGLALGYEDLNDHDELRKEPVFAVLAGKLKAHREDCKPVAGKSTLNRLERIPKRHGAKYHKIDFDQGKADALLMDLFIEAHDRFPGRIVLDLDATDIPLFGCIIFAVHKPQGQLTAPPGLPVQIWRRERIAGLVVTLGLAAWLEKRL